jgi:16S rRNA (uracil1498-N3)-methyltransferase
VLRLAHNRSMRTLLVPSPLFSGNVEIAGDEAHHGRTVLRLRVGDAVRLADGQGGCAEGTIQVVERDRLIVATAAVMQENPAPAFQLNVVVAPPKGDHLADMIRGLTEIGVGAIHFLHCERGERMPHNRERLQRIAGEALKQCRRSHLPQVGAEWTIESLATLDAERVVLERSGGAPCLARPRPLTLIIGPEGGLTSDELQRLLTSGAVAVRIAGHILRIETAALGAAAIWASSWEHTPK